MLKNNSNMGTIYLSGGGDADQTATLDSFYLNNLPNKNILFIPIAKSRDMNGYKKSRDWVVNKLNKLCKDSINISMLLDLTKCEDISSFSAIYIGGGNTYKLLKLMKESGFLKILKKYIENGGIVYGASAGAVLMGQDISTYIEEKYVLENKKYKYNLTNGMGLIGDYSIITHFHKGDEEEVEEYFKRKNNPVITIPEGVGLVVKDKFTLNIGSVDVTIFNKNGTQNKIKPGQKFLL